MPITTVSPERLAELCALANAGPSQPPKRLRLETLPVVLVAHGGRPGGGADNLRPGWNRRSAYWRRCVATAAGATV